MISKVLLIIRDVRLAKLLFTLRIITSWLKINDMSVPYKGTPRKVGITEIERQLFIAKFLTTNHEGGFAQTLGPQ